MHVSPADLLPIRELYGRGMYVQAYRLSEKFGPLQEWTNTAARLLGGRLAIQLGGARLGRWLHLRAYRDTPSHPEAIYYHARYRLEKFGPLSAWRFLRSIPDSDWNDAAPEVRADWYGLHSFVCARLRDFDRAERWLARAEGMAHDRAWLNVERAALLEFSERHEEALAAARKSLEMVPDFRPGAQAEAHLLQILGRDQEALERLTDVSSRIESSIIVAHLAAIQMDMRNYSDARKTYERYAELSPLRDEETEKWLSARRADTAYFLGEYPVAREESVRAQDEFYTRLAEQLEPTDLKPTSTSRITIPRLDLGRPVMPLEVLASLWKMPSATPIPLEPISLDGLPDVRERLWAEQNNLVAIEFTMTPEAAYSVIERGVPFLATMVDAGYSHTQIVCGADRVRQSLWMTDPTDRRSNEAPLHFILERYSSCGPRGLVIIPKSDAQRLDGVEFPDRQQYDQLHRVQSLIFRHDRDDAAAAYESMKLADPTHRLTRLARLALARYDANPTLLLNAIDSLLALFPEDNTYHLMRLNVLRDLGRREERTEHARKRIGRKDADPMFVHHYAQSIMVDPDRQIEAERLMRSAVRQRPFSPAGYYILGNILWEQRRFQAATDCYRFAASLEDRDEQFAESYFRAARALDQVPEAMRFLKSRYERTRGRIAGPSRALFFALSEEDDMQTAFAALETAWSMPPVRGAAVPAEVGETLLFAAEMRTNYNEPEAGAALLEQARPLASKVGWLRSAARQALVRVDLIEARRCWESVLMEDPLAGDVHRNLSRCIADLEGRSRAIEWARAMCDRYPFHYPLHQLLIDWLRGEQVGDGERSAAEPVIRHLINLSPTDAWARRELALHLANNSHADEALVEMEAAREIEPDSPSYLFTLGHSLTRADRVKEARDVYEEAIRRSVDNDVAITELLNLSRGEKEKSATIEMIAEELKRQRLVGDGLLTFREQAAQAPDAIEPDDLLQMLQEIYDEHPDTWQAWSALIQQMTACGRLEEARELAKDAVERYPLLARLWVDLAEVCQAQEDRDAQIDALYQAVRVAPGWSYAARELADAMESVDRADEARVVLEQSVARSPLDPVNHGYLADNLWNSSESVMSEDAADQGDLDEKYAAIDRLRIALKIDPGYDWAWRHLGLWTDRLGEPAKAQSIAREVCSLRPGDPRGWLALARMLQGPDGNEEAIAALDRAITLAPRGVEAYDLKAERLVDMGRFDEAKFAATPAVFDHDPPLILQGRAAWVEARRGNLALACREMQALVNIEPGYYWGWQQLAEWYNELGKSEQFLEATDKLVELRPDYPVALAMRGEAKLQNDDREGAKEDLRDALHLEPGYSYPGMLLFDSQLQDEEYTQARATLSLLEEHVTGNGRAYVVARFTQLAARTKDEANAVEAFEEVVTLPCDSPWPINSSAGEMRLAGWPDRVESILRKTLESAPEFHPWALIAWLETKDANDASPEERLNFVNRCLDQRPRFAQAFDIKAELLCRLGRYEEAMRACHPQPWADRPPLILRGRAAWIMWQQGDQKGAIAAMRDIVQADPDYSWGWQQLAHWYDDLEMPADYLEATENLVRLGPNDPSAFAYRGEARGNLGDRRGSKQDFRRAFEIDSAYAFAGINLFDHQMTDGELEDAGRTLAKLEEHVGGPHVAMRSIRYHCASKELDQATASFEHLLSQPDVPPFVLTKSALYLSDAGGTAAVDSLLQQAVSLGTSAQVGRLFVERMASRDDWSFLENIGSYARVNAAGQEVLFAALDSLAGPTHKERLHSLLQSQGDLIRETHRGWAKAAVALSETQNFAACRTWCADWEARQLQEAWMLQPLVLSCRQLLMYDEANRVVEYVLNLPDDESISDDFRIWGAFEKALKGATAEASQLLERLDSIEDLDELPDGLRVLLAMTQALIDVKRDGRSAFSQARATALSTIKSLAPKVVDPDLNASVRRWAKQLARDAGGISAWFWANFQIKGMPKAQ